MKLTDINPIAPAERCHAECPGWFIELTDGRPVRCDECARAAKRHGLDEVTDADAFDIWRHHVLEMLEECGVVIHLGNPLFPELR